MKYPVSLLGQYPTLFVPIVSLGILRIMAAISSALICRKIAFCGICLHWESIVSLSICWLTRKKYAIAIDYAKDSTRNLTLTTV